MSITDAAIHRAQNQASKNTDGPRLAYVEAPAEEPSREPMTLKWLLIGGTGFLLCTIAATTIWMTFFNGREALIQILGGAVETPAIAQSEAAPDPEPAIAEAAPADVMVQLQEGPLVSAPAKPETVSSPLQGTRKGLVLDFTQQDAEPAAGRAAVTTPASTPAPAEVAPSPASESVVTKIKALDTDEIQVVPLDTEPIAKPDPSEAIAAAEEAKIRSFIDSLDVGDAQKIGSSWVVRVNGRYVAESTVIDRERLLAVRSISGEAILISDAKGRLYPVQIQ